MKLADETFLFNIVNLVNASALTLNSDLLKVQDLTYQWKMSFNPNQTKQTQEVIFYTKKNTIFFQKEKHNHTSTTLFQQS